MGILLSVLITSSSAQSRPRIVLLLFDGLTASDLADPALPHLHGLATSGQIALMNTAVAGPRTETAATLTLALGSLAPSEPTDDEIFEADETVERTTAANVYRRRIASLQDNPRLVHIGWAPLMRRELDRRLIGSVLERTGRGAFTAVSDGGSERDAGRRIGLFSVGVRGVASRGNVRPATPGDIGDTGVARLLRAVERTEDNLALLLTHRTEEPRAASLRRLDDLLGKLDERGVFRTSRFLLVSSHPPPAADGLWDRLSVVVFAGPGLRPGLLSSPTTRTPGLVANIDIAPTLLSWLDTPAPAEMTGRPIPERPRQGSVEDLLGMDRTVYVNGRALIPVFALIGLIAATVVTAGFVARYRRAGARYAADGVLVLMAMPLAMLIAGLFHLPSVVWLASLVLALMAVLGRVAARAASVGGGFLPERGPRAVAMTTSGALLADAFTGQHMVKFSLFSSYQLQGIRFYGIGNEYMGVLIGFALLVAFLSKMRPATAAAWFVAVAYVIGWPRLGANAGGLIAAVVAFTTGWLRLRGKKPGGLAFLLGCAAGLAAAFLLALLDKSLSGGSPSHLGGALAAAGEQGWGYLGEIVTRKIAMNLRIMTHPAVLVSVAGVAAIVSAGNRAGEGVWSRLAAEHPTWRAGLVPAAWGALAALLFNDSGIVAALFLIGAFLATGLYLLFAQEREPARAGALESGKLE